MLEPGREGVKRVGPGAKAENRSDIEHGEFAVLEDWGMEPWEVQCFTLRALILSGLSGSQENDPDLLSTSPGLSEAPELLGSHVGHESDHALLALLEAMPSAPGRHHPICLAQTRGARNLQTSQCQRRSEAIGLNCAKINVAADCPWQRTAVSMLRGLWLRM